MKELETLLSNEQLNELLKAINNNEEYLYDNDGLIVKSNSTDNSLNLFIAYKEDKKESKLIEQEINKFDDYLNMIDDNLFVEICEALGNEELNKIQKCLGSGNLESTRAGISKFKSLLKKVLLSKIEYLKTLLNNA